MTSSQYNILHLGIKLVTTSQHHSVCNTKATRWSTHFDLKASYFPEDIEDIFHE